MVRELPGYYTEDPPPRPMSQQQIDTYEPPPYITASTAGTARRAAEIDDATALADLSVKVWLDDGGYVKDGTGTYAAWTRACQAWAITRGDLPLADDEPPLEGA